jgi:hypothetical protein
VSKPGTAVAATAEVLPAPVEESVGSLVQFAIEHKADVATIERLVALREHVEDRAAAREFAEAMAAFQRDCPPILKEREGKVATAAGQGFSYKYASLPSIARTIGKHLAANGLSYSWNTKTNGGELTVTCTVRHINGHAVASECTIPTATRAGMSDQQKVGSARTFGERLSLIQALGITTADPDLDGAEPVDVARISQQQADDLAALASEVGVPMVNVLKYAKADHVTSVLASKYDRLVKMLEAKRQAK